MLNILGKMTWKDVTKLENISNMYDRKGPVVFQIQRAFINQEDEDD